MRRSRVRFLHPAPYYMETFLFVLFATVIVVTWLTLPVIKYDFGWDDPLDVEDRLDNKGDDSEEHF